MSGKIESIAESDLNAVMAELNALAVILIGRDALRLDDYDNALVGPHGGDIGKVVLQQAKAITSGLIASGFCSESEIATERLRWWSGYEQCEAGFTPDDE